MSRDDRPELSVSKTPTPNAMTACAVTDEVHTCDGTAGRGGPAVPSHVFARPFV